MNDTDLCNQIENVLVFPNIFQSAKMLTSLPSQNVI